MRTAERMAEQGTGVAKGKTEKNRIIVHFKDHCTLFKFSKVNTDQDRPAKSMTSMLPFSFGTV